MWLKPGAGRCRFNHRVEFCDDPGRVDRGHDSDGRDDHACGNGGALSSTGLANIGLASAGRDPSPVCDGVSGGDDTSCTRDVYDDADVCSRGSSRDSTSRNSPHRDIADVHYAVC